MALSAEQPRLRSSRLSRADELARAVEDDISAGVLSTGDRLGTKEDLRVRFNVAVATVNEAIKLLESRGLVEARSGPGGGVFVASPSARMRQGPLMMGFKWAETTMAEYHEVRGALEPLVCRQAARHHSASDIRALHRIVDKMEASLGDPLAYGRLNTSFHRRVAKLSRNAPLRTLYVTLIDFFEFTLEQTDLPDAVDPENIEIHRELVDAIDAGEGRQLDAAMRRHDTNRLALGLFYGPDGRSRARR
jgi:GntR family transcriptional repressor for pyruvate dehydrogenase complex